MFDHMFLRDRSTNPNHGDLNKKEVISFRKLIPPSTTMAVYREVVKADGTVEELRVRFYQGQQKSLQVTPHVNHKGNQFESLVNYADNTDQFLSGDNDYFVMPVVVSVEYLDYIEVYVTNTDATNAYTLSVDVIVDYYGGKNRVV
jgi:hypothetical protein